MNTSNQADEGCPYVRRLRKLHATPSLAAKCPFCADEGTVPIYDGKRDTGRWMRCPACRLRALLDQEEVMRPTDEKWEYLRREIKATKRFWETHTPNHDEVEKAEGYRLAMGRVLEWMEKIDRGEAVR